MSANRLVDACAELAAQERMRHRPEPAWALHVVSRGDTYRVGVLVDGELVVQVDGDYLPRAIDDAVTEVREYAERLSLLDRSVRAARGVAAGNTNEARPR